MDKGATMNDDGLQDYLEWRVQQDNKDVERLIANVKAARELYQGLHLNDVKGNREADRVYNEATHRLFVHMVTMWETGYRLTREQS
jgi:hypothetical protein